MKSYKEWKEQQLNEDMTAGPPAAMDLEKRITVLEKQVEMLLSIVQPEMRAAG
jgi:hypothetical protein